MTIEKTSFLNRTGIEVQHHYLVAFLRLLARYEALRMHTIAYALFPLRTQTAAMAAAQRVVSNAVKLKYVDWRPWKGTIRYTRYYALTPKGARFVNALDPDFGARSTMPSLGLLNKEHRDYGVLIAIASEHRGMTGFSESLIAGQMHSDITKHFLHTPDALTLINGRAVWHEVEMSPRSTKRHRATQDTPSGKEKLAHLVQVLRDKRHITHAGKQYPIALVMHCVTDKIARAVRSVIWDAIKDGGGTKSGDVFEVDFGRYASAPNELPDDMPEGGELLEPELTDGPRKLEIIINRIPLRPEDAWSGVLPWAGCPGDLKGPLDHFMQELGTGEPEQASA